MEGSLPGALLALAYFGVFQLCGLCLARLALPRESAGVWLLLGSVWGSLCLQWFPVLFAFPLGFAPAAHLGALALALLCAGAALWKAVAALASAKPSPPLAGGNSSGWCWGCGGSSAFWCGILSAGRAARSIPARPPMGT